MYKYGEFGNKEFRNIPELDGYQVGEDGTVLSFMKPGRGRNYRNQYIIKAVMKDYFGYPTVTIQGKHFRLSRLVGTAFLDRVNGKTFVLHNDDNKLNNHYSNLRWGTHEENMQDMVDNGRTNKPKYFAEPKLTENEVYEIRAGFKEGASINSLAKKYDVYRNTIRAVVQRRTWKHLEEADDSE